MQEFLNDIVEPKSPIVKVTFLDKEMPPETKYERGIIYDIRCLLDSGEEVIVEMQNRGQDYSRIASATICHVPYLLRETKAMTNGNMRFMPSMVCSS